MPARGAKPKPEGQARHRNKSALDWTDVVDEPYDGPVPDLPESRRQPAGPGRTEDVPLHPLTAQWWSVISRMPHCRLWSAADWEFARSTALVADAFYNGHTPSASELDRREKRMGTTVDARRDLRIRYVDRPAENDEPAGVTNLDDFRDLYSG